MRRRTIAAACAPLLSGSATRAPTATSIKRWTGSKGSSGQASFGASARLVWLMLSTASKAQSVFGPVFVTFVREAPPEDRSRQGLWPQFVAQFRDPPRGQCVDVFTRCVRLDQCRNVLDREACIERLPDKA